MNENDSSTKDKNNNRQTITGLQEVQELVKHMQIIVGSFEQSYVKIDELIALFAGTKDGKGDIEQELETIENVYQEISDEIDPIQETSYQYLAETGRKKARKTDELQSLYYRMARSKKLQDYIIKTEDELKDRFQECERINNEIKSAIDKVRKIDGISPEKSDFEVLVQVYFRDELQCLQRKLQPLLEIKKLDIKISQKERERINAQIIEFKTRILAAVMAYSEINQSSSIGCLEMGENEPKIDCDSKTLPVTLGLVKKVDKADKSNYSEEKYDFIQSEFGNEIYVIEKSVKNMLEQVYGQHVFETLKSLRVVDLQNLDECRNFLETFKGMKSEYDSLDNKVAMLLKRYYNIGSMESVVEIREPFEIETSKENDSQDYNDKTTQVPEKEKKTSDDKGDSTESLGQIFRNIKLRHKVESKFLWRIGPKKRNPVKLVEDGNLYSRINTVKSRYKLPIEIGKSVKTPLSDLIGEEYYSQLEEVFISFKQKYNQLLEKINKLRELLETLGRSDNAASYAERIRDTLEDLELISYTYLDSMELMINSVIMKRRRELVIEHIEAITPTVEKAEEFVWRNNKDLKDRMRLCKDIEVAQQTGKDVIEPQKEKPVEYKSIRPEEYIEIQLKTIQEKIAEQLRLLDKNPTPTQKREIKAEILKYKAQFLAVVMMYSELISSNEIVCCQLGKHQISVDCLLEQLPNVLGVNESNLPLKELGKSYQAHIDNLMNYQVLMLKDYDDSVFELEDYIREYDRFGQSNNEKKGRILLRKYCYNQEIDPMEDPINIYDVRKPRNPEVLTVVQNTAIAQKILEMTAQIGDISKLELDERE